LHLFHLTSSSPIQKYQQQKKKYYWSYQERYKKRWTKWSQINIEWNIIQRSLFETTLTSLVWAFTIIHFHTPILGHDTSLIKSTQIKDWLLSFEDFNLEEKFDLLTSLFYKKGKKKRLNKCVQRFSFKHRGSLCFFDMFSKLQNQYRQSSNLVKIGLSPFNSFFMKLHLCSYSILCSKPKPWPTLT